MRLHNQYSSDSDFIELEKLLETKVSVNCYLYKGPQLSATHTTSLEKVLRNFSLGISKALQKTSDRNLYDVIVCTVKNNIDFLEEYYLDQGCDIYYNSEKK